METLVKYTYLVTKNSLINATEFCSWLVQEDWLRPRLTCSLTWQDGCVNTQLDGEFRLPALALLHRHKTPEIAVKSAWLQHTTYTYIFIYGTKKIYYVS